MQPPKNYASYFVRLIAELLESGLLFLDIFVVLFLLSLVKGGVYDFLPAALLVLIYLLVIHGLVLFFLKGFFISNFGGFLGKLFTGLRIEHEDGSNLTFKRALFRENVGKIASAALLGLGFFWILKDPKKQGWHDSKSSAINLTK